MATMNGHGPGRWRCPQCQRPNSPADRICRGCGYDHEGTGFAALTPPAEPATWAAPPPVTNTHVAPGITVWVLLGTIGVGLWLLLQVVPSGTGSSLSPIDETAGWHTNLAYTTCAEYTGSMTSAQRIAAAGWLLDLNRRMEVTDASSGAEFAGRYAAEIASACAKYYGSEPSTGVIAAATLAYMDDAILHPAHH